MVSFNKFNKNNNKNDFILKKIFYAKEMQKVHTFFFTNKCLKNVKFIKYFLKKFAFSHIFAHTHSFVFAVRLNDFFII